jgi:hypothetical protein
VLTQTPIYVGAMYGVPRFLDGSLVNLTERPAKAYPFRL